MRQAAISTDSVVAKTTCARRFTEGDLAALSACGPTETSSPNPCHRLACYLASTRQSIIANEVGKCVRCSRRSRHFQSPPTATTAPPPPLMMGCRESVVGRAGLPGLSPHPQGGGDDLCATFTDGCTSTAVAHPCQLRTTALSQNRQSRTAFLFRESQAPSTTTAIARGS